MTEAWHLYEVVISNSRVWLKLQASCSSTAQSVFEYRFTGADYTTVDGHRPVTPFRLSQRSHYVANWVSIVDRLQPDGTTTNSTLWGLPIHGAKPCRTTAIATERKGD